MTDYLDLEDVLLIGEVATGSTLAVGDYGLLESALARPRASALGADAYPDLHTKAAALLQSMTRNHALIDGNKRTAWGSCWVFLAINGNHLRVDEDAQYAFVLDVAQGKLDDLEQIAARLREWSK